MVFFVVVCVVVFGGGGSLVFVDLSSVYNTTLLFMRQSKVKKFSYHHFHAQYLQPRPVYFATFLVKPLVMEERLNDFR